MQICRGMGIKSISLFLYLDIFEMFFAFWAIRFLFRMTQIVTYAGYNNSSWGAAVRYPNSKTDGIGKIRGQNPGTPQCGGKQAEDEKAP